MASSGWRIKLTASAPMASVEPQPTEIVNVLGQPGPMGPEGPMGEVSEEQLDTAISDHAQTPIADAHPEGQLPAERSSYGAGTVASALDARLPLDPTQYPEGATLEKRNGIWQGPEAPHAFTPEDARNRVCPRPAHPILWPIFDLPARTYEDTVSAYGEELSSRHVWKHVDGEEIDGEKAKQVLRYLTDGRLFATNDVTPPDTNSLVGAAWSLVDGIKVRPVASLGTFSTIAVGAMVHWESSPWARALCMSYLDNRNFLAVRIDNSMRVVSVVDGEETDLGGGGGGANSGMAEGMSLKPVIAKLYRVHGNSSEIRWAVGVFQGYYSDDPIWWAPLTSNEQIFIDNEGEVGLMGHRQTYFYSFFAGTKIL